MHKQASGTQLPLLPSAVVTPAVPPAALRALASRLPPQVCLGTSSWSFPGWDDLVYRGRYTPQVLAAEGLRAYAHHPLLRAVGVDRTHYAPVDAAQYRTWAAQVPNNFVFLVKAHEACTLFRYPAHQRYGARAGGNNPLYLNAAYAADAVLAPICDGLRGKASVLLFQFAATDLGPLGGVEGFTQRLGAFLRALPRGPQIAVEVRNAAILGDAYAAALASAGAVHCFNVLPNMPSLKQQARLLRSVRFAALVIRWMRHRLWGYDEAVARYRPFARLVDEDVPTRREICWLMERALHANLPVTVVINNKAEGSAPLSVEKLADAVVARLAATHDDGPELGS